MQDTNDTINTPDPVAIAANMAGKAAQSDFVQKIVEKIRESENILIALSRTPSVDEIAAAIGLTIFLDGMQKHATAVYSGRVPDNLAFLQPNVTFETTTDSLQDFIIALSKDKADHLRYKLEGDFVKVFITPYKTKITEEDLTYSYGDYNVDFVISMNVASAGNLDEALREHARIMHDASAVNLTTGQPGRFGEIEWNNPIASSICEMVTDLIFALQGSDEAPLERDVATALLAGIVAATDRFSNDRTSSDTLSIASKLMSMGADQKLITNNIDGNEVVHNTDENGVKIKAETTPQDKTNLAVEHDEPGATNRRNPYAEGGPRAGEVGDAAGDTVVNPAMQASGRGAANSAARTPGQNMTNPAMQAAGRDVSGTAAPAVNPAMQAAPSLNLATTPVPASIASETQNVTPDSAVVPPVMPNTASEEMTIPNMPGNAMAEQSAAAGVNTASDKLAIPNTNAVPNQPSAPKAQGPKSYAEMMEAALSESAPQPNRATIATVPPEASVSVPLETAGPVSPQNEARPDGEMTKTARPNTTKPSDATMVAPPEPVAKPENTILPPPPAPTAANNGMMPPVLPPVQMPPDMTDNR